MSLLDTSQLAQFTGTQGYYRIGRRHLLTDGSKYLADHAQCYWMMDAIASHLCEIGTADWFVLVRIQTKDTQCSGRSNTDPPCRFKIDPGRIVAFALGNCG